MAKTHLSATVTNPNNCTAVRMLFNKKCCSCAKTWNERFICYLTGDSMIATHRKAIQTNSNKKKKPNKIRKDIDYQQVMQGYLYWCVWLLRWFMSWYNVDTIRWLPIREWVRREATMANDLIMKFEYAWNAITKFIQINLLKSSEVFKVRKLKWFNILGRS